MTTNDHDNYTPTDEEVRDWAASGYLHLAGHNRLGFPDTSALNRWLAAHDAEVTATALASTPSPAQPTERPLPFMKETDTHWSNGEAKNWLIDDDVLAPSPVQGADDQLAQAEAVIAQAAKDLALPYPGQDWSSERNVHSVSWISRANSARRALATYQQSPQAALNEEEGNK